MSDPFRSELEAAHARIEKLEADHKVRVADLERENERLRKRLVDAAPPSQSKTGKTFFAIAMITLGVSLVGGMFFARMTSRPPEPHPIFELPMEVAPSTMEIDEEPSPNDFDRGAVASALNGVRIADCGVRGSGHVKITIAPSGVVTEAKVDSLKPTDAAVTRCIESRFREARMPSFSGPARTIGRAFSI